jgi:hypothetical protein
MDRDIEPGFRLRLILGKFRVIKLDHGLSGFRATLDLGNSITLTMDVPIHADLRLNDLLTFYTEVPYAEPKPTPVE